MPSDDDEPPIDYSTLLSNEILLPVLTNLTAQDLLRCEAVSQRFFRLVQANRHRLPKFVRYLHISLGAGSIHFRPAEDRGAPSINFVFRNGTLRGCSVDTSEIDQWGEHIVATRLDTTQAVEYTFKRIAPSFDFSRVYLHNVECDDFLRCVHLLPPVTTLGLRLGILNGPISLPREFFKSEFVAQLRNLEIVSQRGYAGLDSDTLYGLNCVSLRITVETNVTALCVRRMVEQWREGRRAFKSLEIGIRKTPPTNTQEKVLRAIHNCTADCQDFDHIIWNRAGTEEKSVEVVEDRSTYWLVKVCDMWL